MGFFLGKITPMNDTLNELFFFLYHLVPTISKHTFLHDSIVFSSIIVFITLCIIIIFRQTSSRHDRKIRTANKVYLRLQKIPSPQKKMAYIRKVDPFVFEELILTAFKLSGHKIKRNKRYTGDGGIDGQVWIDNQLFLVQAKRYKGSINPAHVTEFSRIVRNHPSAQGLFIHTGRTGLQSKKNAKNVFFISGSKLIELLSPTES